MRDMDPVPFFDATRILDMRHDDWTILAAYARATTRVIASGRYILGPEVEAFEREAAAYLGAPHAVACSSGTDALVLALRCLDVGPGDEVVVPAFTFIATAEAVARVGARPVFADVDDGGLVAPPSSFRASKHYRRAQDRLGLARRGAIGVDLFGRSTRGRDLAKCANVDTIADQAQAFGPGASVGAPFETHSFYPTKNLPGLGDGGLVAIHSAHFADKLRALRNHGQTTRGVHEVIGGNHRLDEIQAACLRIGLQHVDEWLAMRAATAGYYTEALAPLLSRGFTLPTRHPGETWNQYVIRCPRGQRDALRAHLTERGIGCDVYYPHALPHQPCFAYLGHRRGEFPMAEALAAETLALPIFPGLTEAERERVVRAVVGFGH
jgi:dTDP-4-amino-4,6-dideoxygalactose transaminase